MQEQNKITIFYGWKSLETEQHIIIGKYLGMDMAHSLLSMSVTSIKNGGK